MVGGHFTISDRLKLLSSPLSCAEEMNICLGTSKCVLNLIKGSFEFERMELDILGPNGIYLNDLEHMDGKISRKIF